MESEKFNILIDGMWGSSGKGKLSTYLTSKHKINHVSSSNFPNAGHTASFLNGIKFVAKAIPTAACLQGNSLTTERMNCFISPGSGFDWSQLVKEWDESGRPNIYIHDRASIVSESHKLREREGQESTKHIASTMQGSAAAMCDKILRKKNTELAGKYKNNSGMDLAQINSWINRITSSSDVMDEFFSKQGNSLEFIEKVRIIESSSFRHMVWNTIKNGNTWLHEGSQGYSLSIDHGSHYPECTSRNCTVQASMDHMAIPPKMVGDVYVNFRTHPIRVGNVMEDGREVGYSGDFYRDCKEMTWEQVAQEAGMPPEECAALAERERTTVTRRVRRVCNFSFLGMKDAIEANGATKLCMNFIQYINWKDAGIYGGPEALKKLSKESRAFLDRVEDEAGIPIVLIGTGAHQHEIIDLE